VRAAADTSRRQDGARLAMLEEAIDVIRLLWKGGTQSIHGRYYTVEDARLYTLPDEPPPLMIAASNPGAADLAGRVGDAMINTYRRPVSNRMIRSNRMLPPMP